MSISRASERPGTGAAPGLASPPLAALLAILFGGTATLTLLWLLLPHPSGATEPGVLAVVGVCYAAMLLLLAAGRRLPAGLFAPMVAGATLLASLALYFSHEPASPYAFFYVWTVVYAFNWLRTRDAVAQLVLAAAAYAVVLFLHRSDAGAPAGEGVARWALLVGSLVVLALVITLLRSALSRQLGERLRAERQRDEATALLDTLFEQAPVGLGFLDGELRYQRVNTALAEVDGLSVPQHLGRTVAEVLPGPGVRMAERFERVLARGEAISGDEVVVEAPDAPGVRRHWLASYYPVRGRDGASVGVGAVMIDISDRKRAEQQAERMRRLYESIFESAGEGILALDERGRATAANATALQMLGFESGELLGREMHRTIHHSHADGSPYPAAECPISAVLEDGRPRHVRRAEVFWRKDGTSFPVEFATAPLGATGRPAGAVVLFKDVSERREAEAQLVAAAFELESHAAELERSNAELEQFAYVASHDLSEPLRMISGFTQLLAQRYRGRLDDDADEFIGFIVDGVERMQSLINDLLDYSRVGRRALRRERVDVGAVVEQTLQALRPAIDEAGAAVQVEPLPSVPGDPVQLGQLFQNLIANAIKFRGDEPPRVRVSAQAMHTGWRFEVADNGIGIEPRHAERIFKMFQRLHGREDYAGTGIGLAICRKIVERHGGRIWVEAAEGGGSRFVFTVVDAQEAAA